MNEAHNDWDTKLDTILFAYRVSKHRSTGYSPFFMMFHREARLPIEADVEQNETVTSEDIDTETTADAFIEKMLKRQEDIKSIAGENIKNLKKSKRSAMINGIHQRYIIIQPYIYIIQAACKYIYTCTFMCANAIIMYEAYMISNCAVCSKQIKYILYLGTATWNQGFG